MRFRLYKQFGAKNSQPIFSAFERGLKNLGHESVQDQEDIAVIWSVLWRGRMAENQKIYRKSVKAGRPVMIIEVGNLIRGRTWRISLNNINGVGLFGNDQDLDLARPQKIGVLLQPKIEKRKSEILIACQHSDSLQWEGMPSMSIWVKTQIESLKKYTDRPIVVRPHPRNQFPLNIPSVKIEKPVKIPQTYDDYDIDYRYHCVINHNSGPAVQAAIQGVPVICSESSLAYPVSGRIEKIETIDLPDRNQWFIELCHTEWTEEEISQGIPVSRLIKEIQT